MIVIKVFGLDPYLLRDISEDLTSKLASLYEISEDEIDFYGSEGLIVHKGVEQNTWNIFPFNDQWSCCINQNHCSKLSDSIKRPR